MLLSSITIYPIKSLRGIEVESAYLEPKGLRDDRRMMIVDANGRFVSQREHPPMALIDVLAEPDGWRLRAPGTGDVVFSGEASGELIPATVWQNSVESRVVSEAADKWLSAVMGMPVRLVQMTPDAVRYVGGDFDVSFADGFPVLILGEASLADLNERLTTPMDMRRFRTNLVVRGTEPFAEDAWPQVRIGSAVLQSTTRCGRCIMTTFNPDTAEGGQEPLRTLAKYRLHGQSVDFGMNYITVKEGLLSVGDEIVVLA